MITTTLDTTADLILSRSEGGLYNLSGAVGGCGIDITGRSLLSMQYAIKACDAWSRKVECRDVKIYDATGDAFKRDTRCLSAVRIDGE